MVIVNILHIRANMSLFRVIATVLVMLGVLGGQAGDALGETVSDKTRPATDTPAYLYTEDVRQHLLSLKEQGYWQEAYAEYHRLIPDNQENPQMFIDFIHLLLIMERTAEAWDWLHKIDQENPLYQEPVIKKQLTFLRALGFIQTGQYNRAFEEIRPFKDSREDQKLISDIYLLSGHWDKSLITAKHIARSAYHTPYERDLGIGRMKEITENWARRFTMTVGMLDSQKLDTLFWNEERVSWPFHLHTRWLLSHLTISATHAVSFGFEKVYPDVLPRPRSQWAITATEDGKVGARIQNTFYPFRNVSLRLTGFYNEPERGEASLMQTAALKTGGNAQILYGFSDRISSALTYEYANYPHQGVLQTLSTINVYSQHLVFRRPLVYHTVIGLLLDGSGDPELFPERLLLASYVLGISYPLSKRHHDHLDLTAGVGYQFSVGADDGPYVVPKVDLEWTILGDLEFSASGEYRREYVTGNSEWRIQSGLRLDY